MPNQRHTDKRALHVWLPAKMHDRLRAAAETAKLPVTALVTAALLAYLPPSSPAETSEE